MVKEGLKALTVHVPEDMHKEIKHITTERNVSMKIWVMRAIQKELDKELFYEESGRKD